MSGEIRPSVLLVAPLSGVTGGILKWARNILSCYESTDEADVVLTTFDFSRKRSGQMASNVVSRVLTFIVDYLSLTRAACRCIRSSEASTVHITTPAGPLLLKDLRLIRAAHRSGKKAVIHFHFGRIPELFRKGGWELFLMKKVLGAADAIVVMDSKSFRTLTGNGYCGVYNVPNPVSPETLALIEESKTAVKDDSVLFAGHVIPSKGVEELVLACKDIPGIKVRIIGSVSEKYRGRLLSLAGEHCSGWLSIEGEKSYEYTVRAMCSSRLFVLPTYTEGFPNVILESMAAGCGIVASGVGAIPQMLGCEGGDSSKRAGICVEPRSVGQLKEAIVYMLKNPSESDRFAAEAQRKVRDEYEVSIVWNKLTGVWKQFQSGE